MERLIRIVVLGAIFSSILCAQEKDFRDYRFFINPGHGGYDSDDRHMEATHFWESEANLEKGMFLKGLLENKKAKVFTSRIGNTTMDDLPLAVIDEMANAANVDFFISIHSNGSNGLNNWPLVLFRGTDLQPEYPSAKAFADTLGQKLYDNGRYWTRSNPSVRGDLSFYSDWGKLGLAALRTLAVPGVLSEGSFHDYLPESWRLRNYDYLHHESWAIYRSLESHFEVKPFRKGIAAGVIRDAQLKSAWTVPKGSSDELQPINTISITLKPGNRVYSIDSWNNGFYYFEGLNPGNYTLMVDGLDRYASDTVEIVVKGNQTTWTDFSLPAKDKALKDF